MALATGFVSRATMGDRGAASGLYLACCYSGGLVGAAVPRQVNRRYGWHAMLLCVTLVPRYAAGLARGIERSKTA